MRPQKASSALAGCIAGRKAVPAVGHWVGAGECGARVGAACLVAGQGWWFLAESF